MNIETIMLDLYAKMQALQTAGSLTTCSRRLEDVNTFPTSNMPAGFQHQTDIDVAPAKNNAAPINRLHVDWYVYVAGAEGVEHSSLLNPLITALCASIKPLPGDGNKFTLGGTVENLYVDGTIEIYEGVLADRAVAIIPLTIVLPGY